MLAHSAEYDQTWPRSCTGLAALKVLDNEQVILELEPTDGGVAAASDQANMRTLNAIVPGDDDNTPESMASTLGPGGKFVQALGGVRIENVETVGRRYTVASDWDVRTVYGTLSGVVADPATGDLILAWGS